MRFRLVRAIVTVAFVVTSPLEVSAQQPSSISASAVQEAQRHLVALGYLIGQADGQPGPKTISAVKKFQADNHLVVTGELDSKTLTALIRASPKTASSQTATRSTSNEPTIAESEDSAWEKALAVDSAAGYADFYAKFPRNTRLSVFTGTLSATMGGGWLKGGYTNIVFVGVDGSTVSQMSIEEATKWNLLETTSVGDGVVTIKQRAPIQKATVFVRRGDTPIQNKVVAIDTAQK